MWIYADTLKEVKDIERELSSFYRDETIVKRIGDNLLIDEFIASDLYWLKYAEPNDGDKLGDFVLPKLTILLGRKRSNWLRYWRIKICYLNEFGLLATRMEILNG